MGNLATRPLLPQHRGSAILADEIERVESLGHGMLLASGALRQLVRLPGLIRIANALT